MQALRCIFDLRCLSSLSFPLSSAVKMESQRLCVEIGEGAGIILFKVACAEHLKIQFQIRELQK